VSEWISIKKNIYIPEVVRKLPNYDYSNLDFIFYKSEDDTFKISQYVSTTIFSFKNKIYLSKKRVFLYDYTMRYSNILSTDRTQKRIIRLIFK